ncbi:MAG: hypothetical protein ACRD2O_01905, partial [Terriglobia bacterium]
VCSGEEVQAEIGSAYSIGFLDDQLTPGVKTRCSAGKGERQKETEQRENRSFNDADALMSPFSVLRKTMVADAIAKFEAGHHANKQTD